MNERTKVTVVVKPLLHPDALEDLRTLATVYADSNRPHQAGVCRAGVEEIERLRAELGARA